jgi:NitT/TauT family transport system permease protein
MSRSTTMKVLPWITTPAIVLVGLVIWEAAVKVFQVNPLILPAPTQIWESFIGLVLEPATWENAWITIVEIVLGFVIALVLGIAAGVILGKVLWLELSLRPLIVISQVVPKVALIPLFVIWFGFGITSKVIMAAMLAFFPIMLNVLLGVRSVEAGQREVMKSLNAGRWATFTNLEFKSVLPYIFAGMEIGIVFAVIGTIVGEYLGGSEGLGYMVVVTLNALDSPALFAVITLLSAIGLVLYFLVNSLKRFFIPWHESVYAQRNAV